MTMAKADLYLVRKTIREDPALGRLVGPSAVRRRLTQALMCVGYLYFDRASLRTARYFFGQAALARPWDARVLALWLATFLPAGAVRRLRSLKQQFRMWRRRPILAEAAANAPGACGSRAQHSRLS